MTKQKAPPNEITAEEMRDSIVRGGVRYIGLDALRWPAQSEVGNVMFGDVESEAQVLADRLIPGMYGYLCSVERGNITQAEATDFLQKMIISGYKNVRGAK